MNDYRWFNQSLPQTLQIAVILLYLNGVFLMLGGGIFSSLGLILVVGYAAGGFGTANEKKWGYAAGVVTAVLQVLLLLAFVGIFDILDDVGVLISLIFDVALVALLVHPMSRDYQRIWFR